MASCSRISDLTDTELAARLRSPAGLRVRLGSFVAGIRSDIRPVARGIRTLYADFPLAGQDEFCDFPVELSGSGGIRPRASTMIGVVLSVMAGSEEVGENAGAGARLAQSPPVNLEPGQAGERLAWRRSHTTARIG